MIHARTRHTRSITARELDRIILGYRRELLDMLMKQFGEERFAPAEQLWRKGKIRELDLWLFAEGFHV
jgi:hypothetical protein